VSGTTMTAGIEGRGGFVSTLTPLQEVDRLAVKQATVEARQALEAVAVATHRARSFAQRLDEALAGLDRTGEGDDPVGMGAFAASSQLNRDGMALSRREREVLALVAAGHSNKAIASALFVSPNTVKTHVASLLTKLDAASRVQLATIATRQDLHLRAASGVPSDPVPMARSHSRR